MLFISEANTHCPVLGRIAIISDLVVFPATGYPAGSFSAFRKTGQIKQKTFAAFIFNLCLHTFLSVFN